MNIVLVKIVWFVKELRSGLLKKITKAKEKDLSETSSLQLEYGENVVILAFPVWKGQKRLNPWMELICRKSYSDH